jgi:peptidoglycan hydrolase CwlO-like protein
MYAAVFTWLNSHKRAIIVTVACLIILGAAFAAGYYQGSRANVPDNGAGIKSAREQLNQAVSNQQQLTDGISNAAATAGEVTAGIDRGQAEVGAAGATVKRIEAGQSEAAGLITDSQQILARVRGRGKTYPAKN